MTLSLSENRFQLLIDSIADYAIYMLDTIGHIVTWNRGAELNKGYTREEVVGKHFSILFMPEDIAAGVPAQELAGAAAHGRWAGEGWRRRKNGERFWASIVLTTICDAEGRIVGFAKVTRDLSDRKRQEDELIEMEAALRAERDRLRAATESSMDAFFICDALRNPLGEIEDFIFTYLNSNAGKLVSIPRDTLMGGRMSHLFPDSLTWGLLDEYKQVVSTGQPVAREIPMGRESTAFHWLRIQAVKLGDGIAITASDITERKIDEERIRYAASHDHLTGLLNRSMLIESIERAIASAKRTGSLVWIFLIDLDGFKRINDGLGHSAGDDVLVKVAGRLRSAIRTGDSIIRVGGDEFVVVMPGISRQRQIEDCATAILERLSLSILVAGHSMHITGSIGIAVYPSPEATAGDLLRHADFAMYTAKRRGKNQFQVFSSGSDKSPRSAIPSRIPYKAH